MKKQFAFLLVFTLTLHVIGQDSTERKENSAESTTDAAESTNDAEEQIDTDEIFIEPIKKLLQRLPLVPQDLKDSIDSIDEIELTPEDLRIGKGLELLEDRIPELRNLAATWESLEPVQVFSIFTVSIAKYHQFPDSKLQELSEAIDQYVTMASAHEPGYLSIATDHYFRTLVLNYNRMWTELSLLDNDREELSQIRETVLSKNPNAKTRKLDKFLSCVDKTHERADKELTKLFTSLTKSLKKTVASIPKFERINEERVRKSEISNSVTKALVPRPVSKIVSAFDKILSVNCYATVDVDIIREDF